MRISYGVACAAAILLSACDAEGGRTDYANDGDTGAASPASTPTVNAARSDSTAADTLAGRPGTPAAQPTDPKKP